MLFYLVITGLRVYELVIFYKTKFKKVEDHQKRNATQMNIMQDLSHQSDDASENIEDIMNKIRANRDESKEPEPSLFFPVPPLSPPCRGEGGYRKQKLSCTPPPPSKIKILY